MIWFRLPLIFPEQASDDPAFLPVGTEVSAKYRGAFCEAKVKVIRRSVKIKVHYIANVCPIR